MAPLSLSQLLDVAIGTPEVGAVNFTALHSLLRAILGHLGLRDLPAQAEEERLGSAHPGLQKGDGTKGAGEQPPEPGEGSLQGTASGPELASVAADVGQMKKKIEAQESSISKDLLGEIGGVKAAQSRVEEDIRTIQEALGLGNLQDAAGRLPGLRDQSALDSDVKSLKERLSLYPTPEEVSNTVSWEALEDCLVGSKGEGEGEGSQVLAVEGTGGQFAPTKPPTSDMDTPHGASSTLGLKGPETQPVPRTSNGTSTGTPGTQPGSPGTQTTTPGLQAGTPSTQITTPGMKPGSPSTQITTPGMQPGSPSTQTTTPGMQSGSPSTQTTTPGMQSGSPSTQTTSPGLQPAHPGTQGGKAGVQPSSPSMEPSLPGAEKVPDETTPGSLGTQMDATSPKEGGKALLSTQFAQAGQLAAETLSLTAQEFEIPLDADVRVRSSSQELAVPWGSSGSTGAPSCYPEMVEALHQIGQLSNLYATLKEQVIQLEATNLDHAEVEKLRQLFTEGDQESIISVLTDLRDQMSSLQGLASDLQGQKGKIRQLEDALEKLEVAGANSKADGSDQTTLQTGAVLQDIKQELKELREQQDMTKSMLEELVTRISDQGQEQPDKLQTVMKSTGQERAEVQAEKQAECPVCCMDLSAQVGQLLQHYKNLQELVDSFMSQHLVRRVVRQPPGRSQDKELLKHIQATIVHLQGNYEQLSSITGNLLDDSHQKQKDIEALFQSLERMEKEKADKEDLLLGIDVKADKSALGSKVSRTQFDTTMERLNEMIKEMLSKVTGQEQHWHQFQQQLREEMDSKLDRMELGPFQQQLEEQWESILEKMKKKWLVMEADDAAAIKKQLLAPFHCLSCDWPLKMVVSRPEQVAEGRYPRVPRPCGGQHTLTHPLQRRQRLQPLLLQPPTLLHGKCNEMDLLGQDGSIYRGRQDGQPPVLVGKESFLRDKPKLSPRQWDARDNRHPLLQPQSDVSSHSQLGTPASQEHQPASCHSNHSQASGFLPTLGDASRTPASGQDRESPSGPFLPRPPSTQGSGSGQQQ